MDSISRKSQAHQQYNARPPRSGPSNLSTRQPGIHKTSSSSTATDGKLPKMKKAASSMVVSRRNSSASTAYTASIPDMRRIATNSRLRQREQNQRDGYLAFAVNALQEKANGVDDEYNALVEQFDLKNTNADAPSPIPSLRLWLMALSHVVSRLDKHHFTLVQAIIELPWTTMESSFVQAYINFIGILVSARPEYLTLILGKIAHGFTYQFGLQALDANGPEGSSSPLTRKDVYDRLHFLLQHLLDLIPTLPSVLEPMLSKNFPHKRQHHATQVTYIRNLLRVSEYCAQSSEKILSLIIERAISIDVEIQIEMEELEEKIAEQGEAPVEVFDIDPFDTVVGEEPPAVAEQEDEDETEDLSDISSEAPSIDDEDLVVEPPGMDIPHIKDMVGKLDSVLKLIFEHFSQSHRSDPPILTKSRSATPTSTSPASPVKPTRDASPESLERGKAARRAQFNTLLNVFDRTILRTFKSRYTQFLVFWYASLDPDFSDLFQGMLIDRALLDASKSQVERAAAASYLASFVSRASFVGRDSARDVVDFLCGFMQNHLDIVDQWLKLGELPAGQHGHFYSVAQAVFLIFCFRWRDLLEIEDQPEEGEPDTDGDVEKDDVVGLVGLSSAGPPGKKWMASLQVMQRVVTSTLNPLKVCSPNVVQQFARVAHATGFLYCYSILEANKRSDFRISMENSGGQDVSSTPARSTSVAKFVGAGVVAELNTFFPFDPFNLPKSQSWIKGVYREWSSVAIDDEEDEDEDEDEEEAGDSDGGGEHEADSGVEDENEPIFGVGPDDANFEQTLGSFEGMSISPVRRMVLV